jgi:hypothetical protein
MKHLAYASDTLFSFKLFTCHLDMSFRQAPFKAGKSGQAQTCYISQNYNTKKTLYNWFIPVQEK